MPTPQRKPLRRLSRAERAALQRIVHSRSERVDRVRRATALLAVARTGVFIQAAREAGLHSGTTVADLVARFNRVGLAAVSIAPGRGRKATYLLSARAQIVATAQREPDRRNGDLVAQYVAARAAPSGVEAGGHQHHSTGAAGGW
jgi:hypothetical protein